MRGPKIIVLALAALLAGCDREEPAPDPTPAPTSSATMEPQTTEQTSIIRPEMDVERPPVPLEPLRTTIPFSEGGTDLSEEAIADLKAMLDTDQWKQVELVILRGHSDAGGPDRVNMRVSEERAQAVAEWLEEKGLAEDQGLIIAFGAQNPVQPNLLPNGEPAELVDLPGSYSLDPSSPDEEVTRAVITGPTKPPVEHRRLCSFGRRTVLDRAREAFTGRFSCRIEYRCP